MAAIIGVNSVTLRRRMSC